eukprot:COSAG06_NODE_53634_length_299_cov_0.650000_1_plen_54_part_10
MVPAPVVVRAWLLAVRCVTERVGESNEFPSKHAARTSRLKALFVATPPPPYRVS